MPTSPTKRTLDECRKRGWLVQVVERWNHYAKVRVDLFGIIDIVALSESKIIGIQATSGSNHAKRVSKLLTADSSKRWLRAGGVLEVWSWAKRRGKWQLIIESITLDRLSDPTEASPESLLAHEV